GLGDGSPPSRAARVCRQMESSLKNTGGHHSWLILLWQLLGLARFDRLTQEAEPRWTPRPPRLPVDQEAEVGAPHTRQMLGILKRKFHMPPARTPAAAAGTSLIPLLARASVVSAF